MRPRVGFLGTGWIGRHRMAAMLRHVEAAAICEPADDARAAALELAPDAVVTPSLAAMLSLGLDGVVIATPSAQHAAQSIAALEAGAAVFCQKPLGRDAGEVRDVIAAARSADRLLGVDLSYRHVAGVAAMREQVAGGALGALVAVDLVFHNAYGPDKPWFYDRAQAGGGCLIDLGVHLIDLAMHVAGADAVRDVAAMLHAHGSVEDHALATFRLGGAATRLACSWNLHAGQEAVIEAAFYGTAGGVRLRNVAGSFYDFRVERMDGTGCAPLAEPNADWNTGAAVAWARALAEGGRWDATGADVLRSAEALDAIYAAAR